MEAIQNPLLIYLVGKTILNFLKTKDLKTARLVCKSWKEWCDTNFFTNTEWILQEIPNKDDGNSKYSVANILLDSKCTNIRILTHNFGFPSSILLNANFDLLMQNLKELAIQRISYNNVPLFLKWFNEYSVNGLAPNLTKFEITCAYLPSGSGSSQPLCEREPSFLPFRKLAELKNALDENKNENLKSFIFNDNSAFNRVMKESEIYAIVELAIFLKYCSNLEKLKLDIVSPFVLDYFFDALLKSIYCSSVDQPFSHLTSLEIVIRRNDNPAFSRVLEFLQFIFTKSKLLHLNLELRISSTIWPVIFEHLSTSTSTTLALETITITSKTRNFSTLIFQDLFGNGWDRLTNLKRLTLDFSLFKIENMQIRNQTQLPLGAKTKENTLNNLTHLKWIGFSLFSPVDYDNLMLLCPNLIVVSVSCVKECGRKPLRFMFSSFKKLQKLKDLELKGQSCHCILDEDIVGINNMEIEGLRGLANLRRFHCDSICKLTDLSVFQGFLLMPELKTVELNLGGRLKNRQIFTDEAKKALECVRIKLINIYNPEN